MHSHFTVIFDACVLYPVHIRNILVQLATTGLFRARWTDQIHNEWIHNLAANRPDIDQGKLNQLRAAIDRAVPDCLVTGYEELIDGLTLPDENDRHVLAAGIRCHAAVIVTYNLKDYPAAVLEPLGLTAQSPDEFISNLLDLDIELVIDSVKTIRSRFNDPAMTPNQMLELLEQIELIQTANILRDHTDSL